MKNSSDFLSNNLFKFENYPCECQKETIFDAPGQAPHFKLKVCALPNKETLRFSYSAQSGLNQSGKGGAVISENILGQLLSLPSGDIDAAISFLEKFGFLFPVSGEQYETIEGAALLEIIERVKATIMLMSSIAGKRDYKKMLIYTTYLLYTNPVRLELSTGDYHSCIHPFKDKLETYNNMFDVSSSQEIFDNGFISIFDTLYKRNRKIFACNLTEMCSGDGINGIQGSNTQHFRNLFALYTNYPTDDTNLRNIIDFYYNYQVEVGVFKELTTDKITYYASPKIENFTDEMKELLLKIAHYTIGEEINYNLTRISPRFSIETLEPSWKLNSFLEALYFSVFYMKPSAELYKKCENKNCKHQKYFLIDATITNKKYCCQACANAAAQRRNRQRKLEGK